MGSFKTSVWLAAAALCGIGAGGLAHAADAALPGKAAIAAPVATNWTGLYVGGHAGYGGGMKDWQSASLDFAAKGFLGGGQVGVNQQIGNWLIGIEADASWANIKGDQAIRVGGPAFGIVETLTGRSQIESLVTVAGRLGFAADRWLVYLKGGAAWAHETHTFGATITVPAAQTVTASGGENRFGGVLGFGAEYAFAGNWSAKVEYNYLAFGLKSVPIAGSSTGAGGAIPFATNAAIEQSLHLVKLGVNYRFGTPAAQPDIAPSRPAAGFDWSGLYAGAQAGYGYGRSDWDNLAPGGRFDVKGWLAGGTVGANAQAGVFVAGVEGEWMAADIKGATNFSSAGFFGPGTTTTAALTSRADWLALASARVGFVAADRWLVYGKAGVALAHEQHTLDINSVAPAPGQGSVAINGSGDRLHSGYVTGVGVEHAFIGNWSAKLEYNYVNFRLQDVLATGMGNFNIPGVNVGVGDFPTRTPIRQELHLVKFGVNYHFNPGPGPVVAKY